MSGTRENVISGEPSGRGWRHLGYPLRVATKLCFLMVFANETEDVNDFCPVSESDQLPNKLNVEISLNTPSPQARSSPTAQFKGEARTSLMLGDGSHTWPTIKYFFVKKKSEKKQNKSK